MTPKLTITCICSLLLLACSSGAETAPDLGDNTGGSGENSAGTGGNAGSTTAGPDGSAPLPLDSGTSAVHPPDAGAPLAPQADAGDAPGPTTDADACKLQVQTHASEGALHAANCSQLSYLTNPPSSGTHYQTWAAHGVYEFTVPRGFWVHNLEHGAIVVSYNCPQGCDEELTQLTAWFEALPIDAACQVQGAIQPRALLLPDPDLDVRFAASAWLNTLRSDCFDAVAFTQFYQDHVGQGLENVCTSGADFRGPGGEPAASLPTDCGE